MSADPLEPIRGGDPEADVASELGDSGAPTEVWDMRPSETARSFAGFQCYRDLPPDQRSARAVAEILYGPDVSLGRLRVVERWSARHRWVERATRWDEELDKVRQQAAIDAVETMAERHVEVAGELLDLVSLSVTRWCEALQADSSLRIPIQYLAGLLKTAAELERITRGERSEIARDADGVQRVEVLWNEGAVLQVPDDDIDYDISPPMKGTRDDDER